MGISAIISIHGYSWPQPVNICAIYDHEFCQTWYCLLIFDGYSLVMDGKFENQGTKDVGFLNDLTLSGWAINLGVAYFWTKPWEQKCVWGGNNQFDYPENDVWNHWHEFLYVLLARKRKHAILAAQWRDVKCQVKIYDCMLVRIMYRSWT